MEIFTNKKVLIISPHPDDEVFGCGGLIHRCQREGGQVYLLYLTVGTTKDFSKKGFSRKQERIAEIKKIAKFLRFAGYKIAFPGDNYHLQLDTLPQKKLIKEIESGSEISLEAIKPAMVIIPSINDYNQDHRAVNQAVVTATRPVTPKYKHLQEIVLEYELPPNTWSDKCLQFSPNFFVELSVADLRAKVKALSIYRSQLKDPSGLFSAHGIKTLANLRGIQNGKKYAEAFYLRRFIV